MTSAVVVFRPRAGRLALVAGALKSIAGALEATAGALKVIACPGDSRAGAPVYCSRAVVIDRRAFP